MSNRVIVSPTEVLFSSDVLKSNKFAYVGAGRLAQAILGSTTQLNGLPCTPTAPATLSVLVGSGEIYVLQPTDPTAYGVLPIDNNNIIKQGILLDTQTLPTPAPSGVGNSINYLIQVGFSEADGGSTSRQFYNSSNPSSPTFQTVNTERNDSAVVQVKAGVPAPTGTQTTPTPDAGYVGAYVVTVANGQTSVNSGNIAVFSVAPFIVDKLKDKISQASGDLRYAQLSQFHGSISLNGYIRLPGGLIYQWGKVTGFPDTSTENTFKAVVFPIPFQNNVFSGNLSTFGISSGSNSSVSASFGTTSNTLTNTGFNFCLQTPSSTIAVFSGNTMVGYWSAVGN